MSVSWIKAASRGLRVCVDRFLKSVAQRRAAAWIPIVARHVDRLERLVNPFSLGSFLDHVDGAEERQPVGRLATEDILDAPVAHVGRPGCRIAHGPCFEARRCRPPACCRRGAGRECQRDTRSCSGTCSTATGPTPGPRDRCRSWSSGVRDRRDRRAQRVAVRRRAQKLGELRLDKSLVPGRRRHVGASANRPRRCRGSTARSRSAATSDRAWACAALESRRNASSPSTVGR